MPTFSFLSSFAHRAPHSFPTRRSSDLRSAGRPLIWVASSSRSAAPTRVTAGLRAQSSRSEEHTSELQSPCNLVCRLLLEKKNYTQLANAQQRLHDHSMNLSTVTEYVRH